MKYFTKSKNPALTTINEHSLLESPIGVAVVPVSVPLTPIDAILESERYSVNSLCTIIEITDSVIINAPVEEKSYRDKWWYNWYVAIMIFLLAGTITIVIANAIIKEY